MDDVALPLYGDGDASYRAAGELEGLTALVDLFYDLMDTLPETKTLRDMHAKDLTQSKLKLVYFLSGWLGGPMLYGERFGAIVSLPVAHRHLSVNEETRNSWLSCMEQALEQTGYPVAFREYLMEKFATPAESIRLMCAHKPEASSTAFDHAQPAATVSPAHSSHPHRKSEESS